MLITGCSLYLTDALILNLRRKSPADFLWVTTLMALETFPYPERLVWPVNWAWTHRFTEWNLTVTTQWWLLYSEVKWQEWNPFFYFDRVSLLWSPKNVLFIIWHPKKGLSSSHHLVFYALSNQIFVTSSFWIYFSFYDTVVSLHNCLWISELWWDVIFQFHIHCVYCNNRWKLIVLCNIALEMLNIFCILVSHLWHN